jgi:hypothetical protein
MRSTWRATVWGLIPEIEGDLGVGVAAREEGEDLGLAGFYYVSSVTKPEHP